MLSYALDRPPNIHLTGDLNRSPPRARSDFLLAIQQSFPALLITEIEASYSATRQSADSVLILAPLAPRGSPVHTPRLLPEKRCYLPVEWLIVYEQ